MAYMFPNNIVSANPDQHYVHDIRIGKVPVVG